MGGSDTLTRCALRGVRGCVVLPSTLLELGPLVMSAGSNHRASSEVSTLSCQTSVAAKPKGEASTWAEKRRAGYRYGMKKVGPNSFRYPKSENRCRAFTKTTSDTVQTPIAMTGPPTTTATQPRACHALARSRMQLRRSLDRWRSWRWHWPAPYIGDRR